jgi:hypothetical protein
MDRPLRFLQLSPQRQALVRSCQSMNYGYIKDLIVQDQQPVLTGPAPVVLVDLKLDSEERPRGELVVGDFALPGEMLRLMSLLDKIGNGKIAQIEVRAGVARRILFERPPTEAEGLIHQKCSAVVCRKVGRI